MKLVDTNILVYAVDSDSRYHKQSSRWIEDTLVTESGMALAWLGLVGFVRLATRKGILNKPLPVADALAMVQDWLGHPNSHILHPGERHADIFARLLLVAGAAGNLTNDAHLAALAIEHNAEMVSFDRDFKRFSGLKFHHLS